MDVEKGLWKTTFIYEAIGDPDKPAEKFGINAPSREEADRIVERRGSAAIRYEYVGTLDELLEERDHLGV